MSAKMIYGDWTISQEGFDVRYLGKTESIMCLGNGYVGSRAAEEESYVGQSRDTFVSGTFNYFDENEVTELPNIPDIWSMDFQINGQPFSLLTGKIEAYKKTLDLKRGLLTREVSWSKDDVSLKMTFKRFISKKRRHFMASQVHIENLGSPVSISIKTGINGQVSNEGSQHFTEGEKGLVEGKILQMCPQTTHRKLDVVISACHELKGVPATTRPEIGRRSFYMNFDFKLEKDKQVLLEKRASIYTSIDNDIENHSIQNMRNVAVSELQDLEKQSFEELLAESAQSWAMIWKKHPIKITSDHPRDQLAIRFAKYHLHSMVPAHDERMNIGAKGLSGQGYKGHTFWDTEIFMLPYFTFTHPEIAEKLLTYRYLGLEGAHKKAADNGYEGAQYPWEAAWPTDGEVTPVWGAADIVTGKAMKILSGFIEQHITSDVAFGVKQYLDVTGNQDFANEKAYEILIDTAKFWASRLEYDSPNDRYVITNVMGPDEYKEEIDNNAYTNYTAHWNISYVIDLIGHLKAEKPEVYARLDKEFNLEALKANLKAKVDKIFLPQPTSAGIIPQDDTYLSKPELDLTKYKSADGVDGLFHDYNLHQVNGFQVTKQADVLLLMLLFEGLFEKELKLKNFDYYEPKTTHDSSLSLSTHAILSADLGKLDQSYDFFKQAINIDMGEYMKSSDPGIHAASLGGIWQMVVFGYGGVRMIEGELRIEPNLPQAWSHLSYGFDYQGQAISVEIGGGKMVLKKSEGPVLQFIYQDQIMNLEDTLTITL
ncbi:glycoside hydrolase family 65 protein [Lactococcus garvieae]|nr:glycoside hydrolase family 65 protein [Lactococcus garvieae]